MHVHCFLASSWRLAGVWTPEKFLHRWTSDWRTSRGHNSLNTAPIYIILDSTDIYSKRYFQWYKDCTNPILVLKVMTILSLLLLKILRKIVQLKELPCWHAMRWVGPLLDVKACLNSCFTLLFESLHIFSTFPHLQLRFVMLYEVSSILALFSQSSLFFTSNAWKHKNNINKLIKLFSRYNKVLIKGPKMYILGSHHTPQLTLY